MLFCCLFCLFVPATAQSDTYTPTEADMNNTVERFLNFHVDIEIQPDGNIIFTENFTVYAARIDIRRGIIRTIPEHRIDNRGRRKNIPIKVLSVTRNCEESIFKTETRTPSKGREQWVYTSASDELLEKGLHHYTIVYESRGHVGFFASKVYSSLNNSVLQSRTHSWGSLGSGYSSSSSGSSSWSSGSSGGGGGSARGY